MPQVSDLVAPTLSADFIGFLMIALAALVGAGALAIALRELVRSRLGASRPAEQLERLAARAFDAPPSASPP